MTTIPPTVTPQVPAATAAAPAPVVTIPQPPPELLRLPPGTSLEAVVVAVAPAVEGVTADGPRTPGPGINPPPERPRADVIASEASRGEPPRAPPPRDETPDQSAIRAEPRRTVTPQAEQPRATAAELAKQVVVLRTSGGDVQVRLPVPLEAGARVALEVVRGAPQQITARVVAVDDVPVQRVLAQAARATPTVREPAASTPQPPPPAPSAALQAAMRGTAILPGQAWTASGPTPLTAVTPLSAFVLSTRPLAPLPAPLQPLFVPGADLGVRIVAWQAAPTGGGATPPMPAAGSPSSSAAPQPLPASPASPSTTPSETLAKASGSAIATKGLTGPTANPLSQVPGLVPTGANPASGGGAHASTPTQITTGLPTPAAGTTAPATAAPVVATTPASPNFIQTTENQGLRLPGVRGLGPMPPGPPLGVETASAVARLSGQVIAAGSQSALIVRTDVGEVQLNIRANLPVGATVTLEVVSGYPPRADGAMPSPPTPALPTPTFATPTTGWASVSEALQLLQRVDPQTATQLAAAIPDGGPRTAMAAMAFVQAMRTGDPRQWPGDTALRGLERAGARGAQLAGQIASEVRELAARTSETAGEWRAYPLPWNAEGRIERVTLITRREGEGDEAETKKGGKGGGTRFLINLELSRLGDMQLDGMYRKAERGLDMMIRTKSTLPDEMRRDLTGLYANSLAAMGLKGALNFQVVKKFPDPAATPATADKGGLWA